jgi:hypothetical protein
MFTILPFVGKGGRASITVELGAMFPGKVLLDILDSAQDQNEAAAMSVWICLPKGAS